jgi:predicted  nucleic acid-binding Zn-ribbon protein
MNYNLVRPKVELMDKKRKEVEEMESQISSLNKELDYIREQIKKREEDQKKLAFDKATLRQTIGEL